MTAVKWTLYAVLLLAVAALLHYSLPKREVVRITGIDTKRMDTVVETATGSSRTETRDVSFIYAAEPDGTTREFRNEDTDFGWPPYFKWETQNIQSRAANWQSTEADPRWVVLTHYGWRVKMASMFPNVVDLREAESADETFYPWFNGTIIAVLVIGFLVIRRYVIVLYGRHVDPLVDAIDQQWDDATDKVSGHYTGISGFFRRLFGR